MFSVFLLRGSVVVVTPVIGYCLLSSHSLPGAAPDFARVAPACLISLSHEVQSCYSCYLYFTDEEAGN